MDSLGKIIDNIQPDIVVLNETKTKNSGKIHSFFKKRKYEIIIRNNGGVVIAALIKFKIMNVTSTQNPCILAGLLPDLNIRIITAYGPQENIPKEDREEFFHELNTEIQTSVFSNNTPVLVGDLNSKLELNGNKIDPVSSNGELLLEIVNEQCLEVMNFNPLCVGRWTRVQMVKNELSKSVLDYCITSPTFARNMEKMVIDEGKAVCPFRVKRSRRNDKNETPTHIQQYSDHNALLITFKVSYKEAKKSRNEVIREGWKITEEGLIDFNNITSKDESLHFTSINTYNQLEQELDGMMNSCFQVRKKGKSISNKNRVTGNRFKEALKVLVPMLKKGKAEKAVAKGYLAHLRDLQLKDVQQLRSTRLKATLEELQDGNGNMSPDQFWKLRKKVMGNTEERTSIITGDGVEVFDEASIINEYRNEFINRLSHRNIDPIFKEYETATNKLLQMQLNTTVTDRHEPDYTVDEVTTILHNLKAGKAFPDKYPPEVFKHAGTNLIVGITNTLNNIKNSTTTPEQWEFMTIKTMFKNKGSRKVLKYHRGIFLTCIISKVLERLMLVRSDLKSVKINPLQCGSTTGKSPADNIFVINSVIDHAIYLNKTLFITSYDYATCFDSLWLEECLLALLKLGVDSQTVKLLYELNKNACIKVKTPFGDTQSFEIHNIVKQGTVWGSKLCCASTGELCDEDDVGGASVGEVTVRSTIYVDDSNRFNMDTDDTVSSHEKFLNFSLRKRSPLNADKCVLLPVNLRPQTAIPTLLIDGVAMKVVNDAKVLGDNFNHRGNNNTLVDARVKSSKGLSINLIAMCNDVTFGCFSTTALLLLYRTVFVKSIINNSEAWSHITQTNYDDLRTAQLNCLKRMMKVPTSTPNHFIFLELGVLPIEYEIEIKQLMFLYHILTLQDDDPGKLLHTEQLKYPASNNWANNAKKLCKKYKLPDDETIREISRNNWKQTVKTAVTLVAFESLLNKSTSAKKTQSVQYESFQTQKYIMNYNADRVTTIFKLRSKSTNVLDNRGIHDTKCRLCGGAKETQQHAINCAKVVGNNYPLSLTPVYGNVPLNDSQIKEIVKRFSMFEEALKLTKITSPSSDKSVQ